MSAAQVEVVPDQSTAIRLTGIVKTFGAFRVLHAVDFDVRHGEVHALIGGNGAGKSTLMKILQGIYAPDSGTIEVAGKPVQFHSSNEARANGIGMIFQEFSLVPTLTVAQNIFLGHEPRGPGGFLDDGESARRARLLFDQMGVDINPNVPVIELSTGSRQLTEIAKALSQDARILIMDEPNSTLAKAETQALFDIIRRLKQQGIAIIYITHRMEEVYEIADRITVLRDGRRIVSEAVADLSLPQLIEHIVGRKVEDALRWRPRQVDRSGVPLLKVKNLVAGKRVRGITFDLYSGEILGVAGLVGSGRSELVRAIFGIDHVGSGEVEMNGRPIKVKSSATAAKSKLALVPEDRRIQGLILDHSIRDNLLLPILDLLRRFGLVQDQQGDKVVDSYVEELSIKTDSIRKQVSLLSGGNQQKVVIAKWLATKPDILMMDEPTIGVDIGTKAEIVVMIRNLADSGKGIIVISSELPELLAVSDRIIVLRAGTVYRVLDRADIDSHMAEGQAQIGVAEEILHRIIQGESQIAGTGPHGEAATPASQVELSDDEIERIKALKATAAIVFHYKSDWTQAQLAGLRAQFARMGIEVIAVTDAGFSASKQVEDIDKILAQNPSVIVAIPTDPTVTAEAFARAAASGVKLVFMDNVPDGMQAGRDYISVVSGDNHGAGQASAYILADSLVGVGKVGVIFHGADFFVTKQRYENLKETLAKHFPGIQVVAEAAVSGPDFRDEAEKAAAAMLDEHRDLKGIWAAWDVLAEGVVAAAHAAGRNDLAVATVDYGERVARLMAAGDVIVGLGAQRPYEQGVTEAMLAGYGLLGKPAPSYVALPSLTVTKDNLIGAWRTVYHQDPPSGLRARKT